MTLFGGVTATFFAASSAVDTDFVVRLCRVAADGTSLSIADGMVRASWRDSHTGTGLGQPGHAPSLIEPGRAYEYAVSLWQTAYTFAAGEQAARPGHVQLPSALGPQPQHRTAGL